MSKRIRLDQLLVDRGLAESREKAKALILAGEVTVEGQPAAKPGHSVPFDCAIRVKEPLAYVSRAGKKLEAALDQFQIGVAGKVCLDVGSSTGGFTDCLLQRGAARVYAIDVGTGQLDWKLRNDPRVVVREQTNARYLAPEDFPERMDLAVCDVSFISVTLIVPVLPALLRERGEMVILVKPQFELERGLVGKGGIVRESSHREMACAKVAAAVEGLGYRAALLASPVLGAEGNQEFLLYARPGVSAD